MKQSTSFLEEPDEATTSAGDPVLVRVAVPALVGVEPHVAVERLRAVGLVPGVEACEVADEDLVGVVCAQEPQSGGKLERDGVVVVTVGVPARVAAVVGEALEAELVDEDDGWFDIELPGKSSDASRPVVSEVEHGVPQPPEPARVRRVGTFLWRGRRARRIVVLAALALTALVVLATVSGSHAPRRPPTNTPRTTRTLRAPAPAGTRSAPASSQRPVRMRPPVSTSRSSRRSVRQRSRTSASLRARPVPSSAPSHRSASVQPTPCEFCFEFAGR